MRALLIAALMAVSPCFATDYVAKRGNDSVRLTDKPCPLEVLEKVEQGNRGYFRRAFVQINGHEYVACFALRPDGVVVLQYADGDVGMIAVESFKADEGV